MRQRGRRRGVVDGISFAAATEEVAAAVVEDPISNANIQRDDGDNFSCLNSIPCAPGNGGKWLLQYRFDNDGNWMAFLFGYTSLIRV